MKIKLNDGIAASIDVYSFYGVAKIISTKKSTKHQRKQQEKIDE